MVPTAARGTSGGRAAATAPTAARGPGPAPAAPSPAGPVPLAPAPPSPAAWAPPPPPAGAPGPGARGRRGLVVALALLAVVAVAGVIVVSTGDGGDATGAPSTTSEAPDEPATTQPDADTTVAPTTSTTGLPSFGPIRVVDVGWSSYQTGIDGGTSSSYAIVIENTSDQVARRFGIDARLLNNSGNEMYVDHNAIFVLMPGQRFAVGTDGFAGHISDIAIEISEPALWENPADWAAITVSGLTVTFDDFGRPVVDFTATSPYAEALESTYGFAVFRDAEGEIVGARREVLPILAPNGPTALRLEPFDSIADVDPTRTEVFVDPSIF